MFEGDNTIGRSVSIGPGCFISNSVIKNDVVIHANTVIEDSIVGSDCEIGPFARIRGGTEMQSGSELGNFVEANRSKVGKSSKAKHLTYLGDTTLGKKVNVGAIAKNIQEMATLKVPVICIVIGEGASGGALGIGVGDKVYMMEYTWYSVISPESCSSILWRSCI